MCLYSEFQLDAGFLHDHTVNKHHTLKNCHVFVWMLVLYSFVIKHERVFNKIKK